MRLSWPTMLAFTSYLLKNVWLETLLGLVLVLFALVFRWAGERAFLCYVLRLLGALQRT